MVRIRRTVVEEIHVSVPVTDEMIIEEEDGSSHLAPGRIFEEAVRIGHTQELAWRREGEALVEIHPLQTPPPGYPVSGGGGAT
ncbi:MAG TPA: hypothetical protein VM261_37845 [Kofleriaceae bacterium]|nr:hypothetical protein [Kofleriaceae bacterium]